MPAMQFRADALSKDDSRVDHLGFKLGLKHVIMAPFLILRR